MIPLQISYRDVTPSDALDQLITQEVSKLERYFSRIVNCRVLIEHRVHRMGAPFHARIDLSLPGHDIFINQAGTERSDVDSAYRDPVLAVRSAFKKAKRQLQDYARLKVS